MNFDQWIALATLAAGMIVQIAISLKIDHRLKHLEKRIDEADVAVARVDTKLEERTDPRKLRAVEG